jgi:hypothetical protein
MSKRKQEPRSFASDEGQLPEDVLYWANLFRASPDQTEAAMEQVAAHPEPEPRTHRRSTRTDLHKLRP